MKKLLALCLTAMLVLAMVPVIGASAADAALFTVDAVEGAAGEEVTVTVSIAENPGLCTAQIGVGFDATALEVVKITPLMFGGAATSNGPTTANPLKVTWSNPLADTTDTGAIATITFKIKEDATPGTYALAVTAEQENVFDTVYNDVPFTTKDGSVKVNCAHATTEVTGAKDATCKEAGYTGDKVCTVCGETIEAGKTIDKTAHTEVVEGAVDATCSAAGSTGTTKCSVCGEVIKEAEVIDKTAHTEVVEGAKDATCTEAGSTGTTKCSVCGEVIKEAEVIDALGHKEEIVDAKEATCDEAGYTGDKVCSVCGEVLEKGEEIPALGHDIKPVEAKEATCTEAGNKAHFACDVCGATFADEDGAEAIDDVEIKALGHEYVDGKCKTCGEEEKVDEPTDTEDDKTESGDKDNTSPETGDVAGIVVVVAMLMSLLAAVVVLKKKA